MTASATSIPNSRVSISVARSSDPAERTSRGSSTSSIGRVSASVIASLSGYRRSTGVTPTG